MLPDMLLCIIEEHLNSARTDMPLGFFLPYTTLNSTSLKVDFVLYGLCYFSFLGYVCLLIPLHKLRKNSHSLFSLYSDSYVNCA